jgi:hypothetical protein
MAWSTKRKVTLDDDLGILLGDLCREWGFCNHLTADELIADGRELSAEDFAIRVLDAEGMNPEYEIEWRRRIRDVFKNRYGMSTSLQSYKPPAC